MIKKTISVDVCGGDYAPKAVIEGVVLARLVDVHYILCGVKEAVMPFLPLLDDNKISYEFCESETYIASDLSVATAVKIGKNSSMGLAISKVFERKADAVFSSGNTGAYMAMSKFILGMIHGIARPAIAGVIPSVKRPSLMLDLGANSECDLQNLFDFAIMGVALAQSVFKTRRPTLALLNIGSEDIKGNGLVKNASELFKSKLSDYYIGYIEPNAMTKGDVDVIITDGFTGNVALKSAEGAAKFIMAVLKGKFLSSMFYKIIGYLLKPIVKHLLDAINPQRHNGAILLGLNGVVVKSHGNSTAIGVASALKFTSDVLNENLYESIKTKLDFYSMKNEEKEIV